LSHFPSQGLSAQEIYDELVGVLCENTIGDSRRKHVLLQKRINGLRIESHPIDSPGSRAFEISPESEMQFPYYIVHKIEEGLMNHQAIIKCEIQPLNHNRNGHFQSGFNLISSRKAAHHQNCLILLDEITFLNIRIWPTLCVFRSEIP
jgi:hypothetical protein